MTRTPRGRRRAAFAAAAAFLASPLLPAQATTPLPPSCDPVKSDLSRCSVVLVGDPGDVERPTFALPDLVPDVTEVYVDYESIDFDPNTGVFTFGTPILNFDTWAQNLGAVPVDLHTEDPGTLVSSPVSQCISWTTNFVCRERQSVGEVQWHDDHKHYHFDGFASYELRRLLADGSPDFSGAGLIASSPKVSFCLEDSQRARQDSFPTGRYDTCQPVEQGISPGWSDVYPAGIDGQTLSLEDVVNGSYALVISLNPLHRLLETSIANNRVIATVNITSLNTLFPQAQLVSKEQA